jgi:hypothetical protein
MAWPAQLSQLVPNVTIELVPDNSGGLGAILVLHSPRRKSVPTITPEEMQAVLARERELSARQRSIELTKANEALRRCMDALVRCQFLSSHRSKQKDSAVIGLQAVDQESAIRPA